MPTIHLIADASKKDSFIRALGSTGNGSIQVIDYDVKARPNVDYVAVADSFKISGTNKSYSKLNLWKTYFKQNNSDTKLIVVGKEELEHSNYLAIKKVKNQLLSILEKAQNVSEDWEIDLDTTDVTYKLKDFLKPHGKTSLYEKLNSLQFAFYNIQDTIDGKIDRTYEEALQMMVPLSRELFESFSKIWNNYKTYFDDTPFEKEVEEVESKMEAIKTYLNAEQPEKGAFVKLKCLQKLLEIRSFLDNMDAYVEQSS